MSKYEELNKKWELCEFGIKTRVFKSYSQQSIEYIRKHPNYSDEEKIQDIIDCLELHAKEVLGEITDMYNQVRSA